MKKIALLLGSMVILAGTAQGAEKEVTPKATPVTVIEDNTLIVAPVVNETPKFRVTDVKTGIWTWNRSGKDNGNIGSGSLRFYADFAYGDNWVGGIQTRRYFDSNTKSSYGTKNIYKKGSTRTYVSITRNNIYGNNSLGFTYEADPNFDEYDLTYSFAPTNYFSGYAIYGYGARSEENKPDYTYLEIQPQLSYKGWAMSYYFEGRYNNTSNQNTNYEYQQLRFFTPKYTDGNFSISGEWRTWLSGSARYQEGANKTKDYRMGQSLKNAFNANRVYAHMNYKVNDSATVFTNLGYEIGKWESNSNSTKKSYQTIVEVGVNFKI